MRFYSPLRYPGGKGRLSQLMKEIIKENDINDGTYIEPYAGGAAVALVLLMEEYVWKIVINDIDPAIYAFWHSVLNETEWILKNIMDRPVTMDEWYRQKDIYEFPKNHSLRQLGFATFFLNRTNRSGILKAGVIGGKKQAGKYKLDARYDKKNLSDRIKMIARRKNRIQVSNQDASVLLDTTCKDIKGDSLFYFDPPYYNKGSLLYTNHYTHGDHERMAMQVKGLEHPWLVTYDNVPAICNFYSDIPSIEFTLTYSANSERAKGSEVMFFKGIDLPEYVKRMKQPYFSRYNIADLGQQHPH